MTDDTVTLRIETDEDSDELQAPAAVLDMLREGEETDAEIVGDIAMFGIAQRIHGAVHHAEGEIAPEVEAAESTTMDLFEERFGASYAEMTGHSH